MCNESDPMRATTFSSRLVGRRRFLEILGVTGASAVIAACAPNAGSSATTSTPLPAGTTPAATTAAAATASPAATAANELTRALTWYKQAAFRLSDAKVVYIDAWQLTGDMPQADLVLVTHPHQDHFSRDDIAKVTGPNTTIIAPADVAAQLTGNVKTVKPGDSLDVGGVKVNAVHAYNNVQGRSGHRKESNWVGYVVELGGRSYYHSGDTDNVPELASVKADVALVTIGGTFTMDPNEAATLVKTMRPRLAVPMHYGYVVGSATDSERFRAAAGGVDVSVLTPVSPFTRP